MSRGAAAQVQNPFSNSKIDGAPVSAPAKSRAEILQHIERIIRDILGSPDLQLAESTTAPDVPGWDSLTHVQIIIGIEQAFGFRMTTTEVAQLQNTGSLIDVVQRHEAEPVDER